MSAGSNCIRQLKQGPQLLAEEMIISVEELLICQINVTSLNNVFIKGFSLDCSVNESHLWRMNSFLMKLSSTVHLRFSVV